MTPADPQAAAPGIGAAEKAQVRRAAGQVRQRAFDPADKNAVAAEIARRFFEAAPLDAGDVVSAYWPMRSEIDPRPLLAEASARGHVCGLPVVAQQAAPLVFRRWLPGDALVAGSFGEETPSPDAPEVTPTVLVVPLLAFDRRGYRLGYGGGFYDRTLATLRAPGKAFAAGIAFAAQELPEVPIEDTDERLDVVLTETETIWPSP